MKYLLSYAYKKNNFNYTTRLYIERLLKLSNHDFTYDKKSEFDEIIALSSEDYFAYFSHSKPSKKVSLIVLNDINDFLINKKNNSLSLSPIALSTYKKVDTLLVFSNKQKEFLIDNYNFKDIKIIPLIPSFDNNKKLTDTEKKAFRKFYRISDDKKIIISYGNYKNKEEVKIFESIARTNPESIFLFFGINGNEFVKTKLLERVLFPTNIYFNELIKEELYYSAIYSSSCLLLTNNLIVNANIIADFMKEKKPIITLSSSFYDNLLSSKNVIIPDDFDNLFDKLNNITNINNSTNAYNYISNNEKGLSKSKLVF